MTELTDQQISRIEEGVLKGESRLEIAKAIGIRVQTLARLEKTNPRVIEAILTGERLAAWYKEVRQIETLAGYGLTLAQIAQVIECSIDCLRKRRNATDLINDAIERGRAKAEAIVGRALFRKATEDGDVRAIQWWEMTRARRRPLAPEPAEAASAPTIQIVVDDAADDSIAG